MNKKFKLSLFLSKGNMEILKFLENQEIPIKFKELRELENPNTKKKYSSATIATSLKELEQKDIITNEIKIKNKKKIIGYSITSKGKKTLSILRETEEKLKKL